MTLAFILLYSWSSAQHLITPYEKGNGNQTTNYSQMLDFYSQLDKNHSSIRIIEKGKDDNNEPLRVVLYSSDQNFDFSNPQNKAVVLINNGIHPGEPDGIDTTMMMMRDFAEGKRKAPKNVIIAAIEAYNISGMLNRGKFSRANQNGPEEYGFRGNARNYDLNRDFIKTDTRNAEGFQEIFQMLQPVYFIDNHVSNGADYQYLFTYINTNKERLGRPLGNFLSDEMQPNILKKLNDKNILTVPYVNIHGDSPDEGFATFMDSPRYATGYTSLFNVPGVVAETHMLKPYHQRVTATLAYMNAAIDYVGQNIDKIKHLKAENLKQYYPGSSYTIQWKEDRTQSSSIDFKGYEAGQKPSEVSGKPRLFYDRSKPFTRPVKFFDTYQSTKEIKIPRFYVVPKSEWKVIEALNRNKIKYSTLKSDSLIDVESYKIKNFETVKSPYEGHYLHYNTEVEKSTKSIQFSKGDLLVSTQQVGVKFLLETVEPEAVDSFFNWNFFDAILGQKEYYSSYVFEDTAAELLKTDSKLKAAFDQKLASDPSFAQSGDAQLDWVYRNSPYYEAKTHRQFPIYRIP